MIIANTTGYMEADGQIFVSDDEELTDTVCDIVNEFKKNEENEGPADMFEFAEVKLLEIYGNT